MRGGQTALTTAAATPCRKNTTLIVVVVVVVVVVVNGGGDDDPNTGRHHLSAIGPPTVCTLTVHSQEGHKRFVDVRGQNLPRHVVVGVVCCPLKLKKRL